METDTAMSEKETILIVDDDDGIRNLLAEFLGGEGYRIVEGKTGGEALPAIEQHHPDLLIMDMRMPEQTGMQVLQAIKDKALDLPVLLMTAYGTSNIAIQAIQAGAYDYITKPFDLDEVHLTVRRCLEHRALTKRVEDLTTARPEHDTRDGFVGNASVMGRVFTTIGRVAASDATVLITGESGTGKELAARKLHENSRRRAGPYIAVNCAALTETILESELFGHEKGAFTTAVALKKGRFEIANKGTIFLDEIGEMSLNTQKKLLRVLQEREFERVGGIVPIKVDTRVIAASNKVLEDEVREGRFRADLYYRLNVISIVMPPLRDRRDDIPLLVEHFLGKYRISPSAPVARISDEALEVLMEHDWPGNVRELENTIERAVVLAQGKVITPQHLSFSPTGTASRLIDVAQRVSQRLTLREMTAELERQALEEALRQTGDNRGKVAEMLDLSLRQLHAKMRDYGLAGDMLADGEQLTEDAEEARTTS
jgi:two-component system response regulator AtoC